MSAISSFKLSGAVPATFTPMKENGDVDYDGIDPYCKYLVDNGITQIFVNGTTGEGYSMTLEERQKVAEKWIDTAKKSGMKGVVITVGAVNLHDTVTLAKHAAKAGADAIAAAPLIFFKPKTTGALVQYCKAVTAAAPHLPFYYYHVPVITGVQLNMETFLKSAAVEVPSLVGLKFSDNDLVDMIGCVHVEAPHRDEKRYNILFGCDSQLVAGLVTGADGGVGSTYNVMPNLIQRITKNIASGNLTEARKDQYRQQQYGQFMRKYDTELGSRLSAHKAFFATVGVNLGPVRDPLVPPSAEDMQDIRAEMDSIGFFEWR